MDGENQNNLLDAIEKASQNEEVFRRDYLKSGKDRTGLDEETLCAIETIIFMSDKPVSLQKIKQLIDEEIPLKTLHQALESLQADYEVVAMELDLLKLPKVINLEPNQITADLFKTHSK